MPSPIDASPTTPVGPPSQPVYRRSETLTTDEQREQYAEAAVTFDKTIRGHYRDGKATYARVGVLFLTWEADDLQCKATEVDSLRELFAKEFNFETDVFEIPSQKCSTALMAKLAAFCHQYDSSDCLTIIYYGGHGYPGTETGAFKLAAKVQADADGDPTVFFNDIQACLLAPDSDQLVIIDCCYSARAFAPTHIGKRKFELITSAAHDVQCDAPHLSTSFTLNLNQLLRNLLDKNPQGFCTAQLYRELYHRIPEKKPLLFDQSRWSHGKIWLRPQRTTKPRIDRERTYLNLTLKLNEQPEGFVMNELASHLQFLPYVDEIKLEKMFAPRRDIEDFMTFVQRIRMFQPLIRRIRAKRLLRKRKLPTDADDENVPTPLKLVEMQLSQTHESLYDWSSARKGPAHKRRRSSTWPPTQADDAEHSSS